MTSSGTVWQWPPLLAHRGGGWLAPENTLAAIRLGHAWGFAMIEYDVRLSGDGIPVLLHDDDIRRTSSGQGDAATMTLAQLQRYDYGSWHSPAWAGEAIPTLYGVAAYTLAHNMASNIEIKPHPGTDHETGRRVAEIAAGLWEHAELPPLLSSFSHTALAAARDSAPALPRALLIDKILPQDWRATALELGCMGLNLQHGLITPDLVREVHAAGLSVLAWTVNDPARARRLLQWGCDAIVTDALEHVNADALSQRPETQSKRSFSRR